MTFHSRTWLKAFFIACFLNAAWADRALSEEKTSSATTAVDLWSGLETVSVHSRWTDLSRIAGSAHTIGPDVLETFEYDDVQRALTRVPGVYVRDEDGWGLRPNIGLRGANSNRSSKVTLMEDGILLAPAPYSAPAAYYFPLTTRMTNIEVFKGPAAIRHGPNTVGGAINLTTAPIPTDGFMGYVDLALGQFNYGKGHGRVGWGDDQFGVLLEGARIQSTGFKTLDDGGDTGFAKNELSFKTHYSTDPAADVVHRFDLKLGYATDLSKDSYLGISDEDFAQNSFERYQASEVGRMNWNRRLVQLGYTVDAGDNLFLKAVAYRNDFSRLWRRVNSFADGAPSISEILRNPGDNRAYVDILRGRQDSSSVNDGFGNLEIRNNDRTYVSTGLQIDGERKDTWGQDFTNRIMFGARFHYDRIRRNHTEDLFSMVGGTMVRQTDIATKTTTLDEGEAWAMALYLHDEISLFEDFFVTPGARVEVIRTRLVDQQEDAGPLNHEDVVLIPGLGLYYQATTSLGLLAGVHQGFSPLAPGQQENANPEKSINYELGGRFRQGGLRAEVIGYFNDYSNLNGTCTLSIGCRDDSQDQQFNGGRVWVYGLEAGGGINHALTSDVELSLDLTYTLTMSEFRHTFSSDNRIFGDVQEGDRLPYLPVHQANASVGLNVDFVRLAASYTLVGQMFDTAGTESSLESFQKTDTQHVIDVAAHFRFSAQNALYLRIDNLLNQTYIASRRPLGARPGKPFQFQFGYTHRFGS